MESTFIIIREDLQVDPVTIVAEGLLVGRLPTCELLLNHPSVSRLHAGITNAESDFYIRNLRPGNPILLNGEKLEDYQRALRNIDIQSEWANTQHIAGRERFVMLEFLAIEQDRIPGPQIADVKVALGVGDSGMKPRHRRMVK